MLFRWGLVSLPWGNTGWVYIAQLPGDQYADKQRNRQTHTHCQRTGHFFGCVGASGAWAKHKKQRGAQTGDDSDQGNGDEVWHNGNYRVNAKIKFGLITIAAVSGVLITAALGNWQLSRAAQKLALQADIAEQSAKPPMTAKSLRALPDAAQALHRRATIRGFWVKDATVYLENRPMNGHVGFVVVTPLVMEAGSEAILVQRGWVPRNFESRGDVPALETPLGMVDVEGMITPPPSKLYEPGPSAHGLIRQNIDLPQFQTETGLTLLPVTLQQAGTASQVLQRDRPPVSLGVEKNKGYAFQWFGLSCLIAGLYLWFQVIRRFFYRPQDPSRNV